MLVSKLVAISLLMPIQYTVPMECIALANKEGFPSVLENKTQLLKAKARLVYLRATNPKNKEIRQCDKVVNELILFLNK